MRPREQQIVVSLALGADVGSQLGYDGRAELEARNSPFFGYFLTRNRLAEGWIMGRPGLLGWWSGSGSLDRDRSVTRS